MTITNTTTLMQPTDLIIEFIRVEYDIVKATKAIKESPLPDEFAQLLIEAR